jgi:membrane protein DedA with SNARE-associated domain
LFLTHLTDSITGFITNLYMTTGLAGIVLAMAIESCCIPLPSEIVMPLAGVMVVGGTILSGVNPVLALILVALAGATGCLVGSIAAYGIGYAGGRPLMLKYGRYVLISHHDADRADAFFQRWGSATAFFSRLLPVVRTYISLPAGIAKMPFARFCIYTFLGSFPWCLLLAFVGTLVGNNLSTLGPAFHSLDIVIIIAVVVLVALYVWRHIRNDRRARALHAAEAATTSMAQQPFMQNGWERQPQEPQQQQGWGQQIPQQSQQQWGQSSPLPGQQAWGQPSQPQQQGWGQPMPPKSPQQFQQQQGWGQQVPQQQPQQGWDQQPRQPPQQPPQQAFQQQGQGWGQQIPPQSPQPQQQWGRVQSPSQQPQPPQQQSWPAPNSPDGWDGQRR